VENEIKEMMEMEISILPLQFLRMKDDSLGNEQISTIVYRFLLLRQLSVQSE
jgi:hypothetical protein